MRENKSVHPMRSSSSSTTKSWLGTDLRNFNGSLHHFDFTNLDPTVADININLGSHDWYDIYFEIGQRLEYLFSRFELNIYFSDNMYTDELDDQITDWLNNWFDYFDFYIKEHKYADEDSCFISDVVCYQLGQDIPGLTFDLYKYFSLSHTELFVGKKVPVTLYFNEDNKYADLGIAWVATIYVKGYDQI